MSKTINIRTLFEILQKELGRQNWWPAGSTEEMLTGMVLIQNTNWKNADRSISKLQESTGFQLDKMLNLSQEEMEELIQPSGFFHNKAIYIRSLLTAYRDNFDNWSKLSTKDLRKQLLKLKGIGNETADVLLLYYFDRSTFVADNYTMRLFKNMKAFNEKPKYMELKNQVEQDFDFTPDEAGEFHALLDEFGKLKSDFFDDYVLELPEKVASK
ncbi:endonuclease III domain-containing protein [Companilactobacillus mishanensis]|uniref:endonuclease III domain-containing protein n=1 Tax=Companilactobacillus mishanensis TaxID=2486008 RepID=UPI001295CBD1|nr:endonuclease III [Companilactobacillus mishanensis]MQS89238.1 endonuclease III [Companilactobacillus mishanensis]